MRVAPEVQKGLLQAYGQSDRRIYVYADESGDLAYLPRWSTETPPTLHPDKPFRPYTLKGQLNLQTGEYGEPERSPDVKLNNIWLDMLFQFIRLMAFVAKIVLAISTAAVLIILFCCGGGMMGHTGAGHRRH